MDLETGSSAQTKTPFIRKIFGYRSGTPWKMTIASIGYAITALFILLVVSSCKSVWEGIVVLSVLLFFLSIFCTIITAVGRKPVWKVWGILIIISLVFMIVGENHKDPQSLLTEARKHFKEKKYSDSILDYSTLIQKKASANLYNERGLAYLQERHFSSALQDFDQAARMAPKSGLAYAHRGAVYLEKGEFDKALAQYNQAIALNYREAKVYNDRGFTYLQLGRLKEAIADFDQAINIDAKYFEAYVNRGHAKDQLSQESLAIEDLQQAIYLNPNIAAAYNNLGKVCSKQKKYDEALNNYTRAINLDSNNAVYYFNRSYVYYKLGKRQNAIDDLNRSLAISPGFQEARQGLQVLNAAAY